jgi:hypothetical protein
VGGNNTTPAEDDDLAWSAWMPLSGAHPLALQQLPEAPGFLRIRRENSSEVMVVESAEGGVRARVERLARLVRLATPPTSSDSLANQLWTEHRETGIGFQVSGAIGKVN